MIPLSAARRRVEAFAAAVDGHDLPGRLSADDEAFLALADQLRELEPERMRSEFSADLRERLMAAAPAELADIRIHRAAGKAKVVRLPSDRRRRALSAAAALLVVLGSGLGVAAASQSALPGDVLYPVKRGIERVEVSTAGSSQSRGRELLDQASTRLQEVQDLAIGEPDDPQTPHLIADTLDDFTAQATKGATSLLDTYQADPTAQSIVELRTFTSNSAKTLDALGPSIPSQARSNLSDAARTLNRLDGDARDACPLCSDLAPLSLSAAMLHLQQSTEDILDGLTSGVFDPAATGQQSPQGPLSAQPGTVRLTVPTTSLPGNLPGQSPPAAGSTPSGGTPRQGGQTTAAPTTGLPTLPTLPGVSGLPSLPGLTLHLNPGLPTITVPGLDLQDPLSGIPQVLDDTQSLLGLH